VTLVGENLQRVTGVRFNETAAEFTLFGENEMDAQVPANATSGPITVESAIGTHTTAVTFIVEPLVAATDGDVALQVVTSAHAVQVGESLTYTLLVTNRGAVKATGVVLTTELPLGASALSGIATQGSIETADRTCVFRLGELAGHATAPVQLVVRLDQSGLLSATATVKADAVDPDPLNNTIITSTHVRAPDELIIRTLANGQVELSWPTQAVAYVVQSADRLSRSPVWTPLKSQSIVTNQRRVVIDQPTGGSRFYRLSAP
jgi:uncharacterized repeat protein (TIGR01451 family)